MNHPNNIPEANRYLPPPVEWSNDIPRYIRRDLTKQSCKQLIDFIWFKHRSKIVACIFMVNREKKKVLFRFSDLELTADYADEKELDAWLNIQLLKFTGCTLDLYYVFYHLYTRKIGDAYGWLGFSSKSKLKNNLPEI
jgi:hypothetical protein